MRLLVVPEQDISSDPLKLIEAFGKNIPEYAILSHTWGRDEVLYTDLQNGTAPDRLAYDKIRGAMAQARKDGHHYLWVDTCCIDKSSSAELQEAINSMFAWYTHAEVCYVYLADVYAPPAVALQYHPGRGWLKRCDSVFETHFTGSRWFTRGWTLQELIAPRFTKFFSSEWYSLGVIWGFGLGLVNLDLVDLSDLVATRTGIDVGVLSRSKALSSIDISTRLSWAKDRETSREEDIAYCFLVSST